MPNFNIPMGELAIVEKISTRTADHAREKHNVTDFDRVSLSMAITACHMNGCQLKLQELLEADERSFIHDVVGIARNIDTETGKLKNSFLPYFAQ